MFVWRLQGRTLLYALGVSRDRSNSAKTMPIATRTNIIDKNAKLQSGCVLVIVSGSNAAYSPPRMVPDWNM